MHFIQNEDDVVFPAEAFEQLQIGFRRVIRTAATQVGFGNQRADFVPELMEQGIQFTLIGGAVKSGFPQRDITAFVLWEANELHTRIAFRIVFRTCNRIGQAFFSMKAVASGDDERACFIVAH